MNQMNNTVSIDLNEVKSPAAWMVGLSNGQICIEGKGDYIEIENEPSPWNRLLKYITLNHLKITASGILKDGHTYYLPSQTPRFGGEIPLDYGYGRLVDAEVYGTKEGKRNISRYIFIDAVYTDHTVRLLVDENGDNNSWVTMFKTPK